MAALAAKRTLALAQPRSQARSLFGFPSPFGSSSSSSSSPPPQRKGTLKQERGVWVYREDKVMPCARFPLPVPVSHELPPPTDLTSPSRSPHARYSPDELFTVIADVDSYQQFLPFTSSSRVLRAAQVGQDGRRTEQPLADRGWLRPGQGERWEMDGELRIGAMGFDEGYVSLVELEKAKWVKVSEPGWATVLSDSPSHGAWACSLTPHCLHRPQQRTPACSATSLPCGRSPRPPRRSLPTPSRASTCTSPTPSPRPCTPLRFKQCGTRSARSW